MGIVDLRKFFTKNISEGLLPVGIGVLTAFMAILIFHTMVGAHLDFYNELWVPAYLLVHGLNPYDTSSFNTSLPAIWLPMGIFFFAPLGWLDERTASLAWFVINIIEILVINFIALKAYKSALLVGIAAFMVYFFPPVLQHLTLGQFSITAMMSLMIAAYSIEQQREWPAAIFLVLGCTKPQLGFLAVFCFGYYFYAQSRLSGLIRFGIKIISVALFASMPFFIIHPTWVVDYLAGWARNPKWNHPSIISILNEKTGWMGYIFFVVIILGAIATCIYFLRKSTLKEAILWSLALTPLVSPYIWSWDFVLLLPLWISTFVEANLKRKIFLFLIYLIGWVGMFYIQIARDAKNQLFWWVPPWFITTILISKYWKANSLKISK